MRRRINGWPSEERPRERLAALGVTSLSGAELIALVLRSGSECGVTAVDQAREILARCGGVAGLARLDLSELLRYPGIDLAKAASLLAAVEVGQRLASPQLKCGVSFRTSADVYGHYRRRLVALRKEVFCVILLDAKHRKLSDVQVSEGSLTSSIVHPREVFAPAVRESAAAVILVHNHPSGDPQPSREDVDITRRLREAGELMGVSVLDHVIVAAEGHFSFVDSGYW